MSVDVIKKFDEGIKNVNSYEVQPGNYVVVRIVFIIFAFVDLFIKRFRYYLNYKINSIISNDRES